MIGNKVVLPKLCMFDGKKFIVSKVPGAMPEAGCGPSRDCVTRSHVPWSRKEQIRSKRTNETPLSTLRAKMTDSFLIHSMLQYSFRRSRVASRFDLTNDPDIIPLGIHQRLPRIQYDKILVDCSTFRSQLSCDPCCVLFHFCRNGRHRSFALIRHTLRSFDVPGKTTVFGEYHHYHSLTRSVEQTKCSHQFSGCHICFRVDCPAMPKIESLGE
jgi:hypothetical protein